HETTDSYTVTVDVSDGTNVTQETFTIGVDDNVSSVVAGTGSTIEIDTVGEVVDLSNMDVFPELDSSDNLEATIGTEVFEDMVSDAENLTINYQSDATVTFQGEIAGYKNTVGAYQINEDGTINGAQLLWGDASTTKLDSGESTATYEGIEAGSNLGFFVISNGFNDLPDDATSGDGNTISETGTWMFVSPGFDENTQDPADHLYNVNDDSGSPVLIYVEADGTIHTSDGNIFHSTNQAEFNPDPDADFTEHFIAGVDAENGVLNFGFEDQMDGGDHDFNDGMFSVEIDVRDLVDAPNSLFSEDANGQSSFTVSDTDNTELSSILVTVSDVQAGDAISVGGAYEIIGGEIYTVDGTATGIDVTITESASDITISLTGDGDIQHYEAIVQDLNFSNDGATGDIAGDRSISVVATDSSGEISDTHETTLTVGTDADNTMLDDGGGAGDYTVGTASDETLTGASNDDTLIGGDGDDELQGNAGHDVMQGGAGDDAAYGGAGDDIYSFGLNDGMDTFIGGDGGGWSDTIVLSDGMPSGDVGDWLTLTSGHVETTDAGEIFLSEDAAGTIDLGNDAVLTFEGVEKIEA
ncbi:MAG: DUF4114 domain-containing protein, partial [Sneathiella sp.]